MQLAEAQDAIRDFVVAGNGATSLRGVLIGGGDPLARLAIHRRHYRASMAAALRTRFPATAWLVGERAFAAAADVFVASPPAGPCMAEYGTEFPAFLGCRAGINAPYLQAFATLEWLVGLVSLEVAEPVATIDAMARAGEDLTDCRLVLQPGLRYLAADWPVDRLFDVFLADSAPDVYWMGPEPIALQVRGACGAVRVARITPARLAFRAVVADGTPLGQAVGAALAIDPAFDPEGEVAALVAEGLLVSLNDGVSHLELLP